MASKVRSRAKIKGNVVTVKALVKHPMHTGRVKGKDGKVIPAHFINMILVTVNGNVLMNTRGSCGVSKNPHRSFEYTGSKVDKF